MADARLSRVVSSACEAAGVDKAYAVSCITRAQDPYEQFSVKKRSGGRRRLDVPAEPLMALQRSLLSGPLSALKVHPPAFAYRPGAGIKDCAQEHSNTRWLVRIDLRDFFTSIDERMIYHSLRPHNLDEISSFEIARLVTRTTKSIDLNLPRKYWEPPAKVYRRTPHTPRRLGFLPQGAPTSGHISNLVMRNADNRLARLALENGVRYTRYADDLHFSTSEAWGRREAASFIADVSGILSVRGFAVNEGKTRISGPGTRRSVLGLLVDGATPRLSMEFKRRIDWHLRGIELNGVDDHAKHARFSHPMRLLEHVRGLLDFASDVDPDWTKTRKLAWDLLNPAWRLASED